MPDPVGLPSVMKNRLDAMRAAEGGDNGNTPPADNGNTPPADSGNAPPADNGNTPPGDGTPPVAGERVTLSRDEFNALQAASGRATTADARAADAQARLDELTHRLTELENQGKPPGNGTPPASPPANGNTGRTLEAIDATGIVFTPEEEEQFGESRSYVERVAQAVVVRELNKIFPQLNDLIGEVRNTASTAATVTSRIQATSFNVAMQQAVPDLQALIKHKNWEAFLDEVVPFTKYTFEQMLGHYLREQDVPNLKTIYDGFRDKYVKPIPGKSGWESGAPDGGATPPPNDNTTPQKLKLSDRTKASEDYRKGRLSWDNLQKVNKQFDEADKKGLVDYNA
jgi:hypothetical protein